LLRTSIMDRFCADLCNVLAAPMEQGPAEDPAERITGDAFIEWLKVNNLFLIPLDSEGRWFRYHHLFQDLLRNQLQHKASPDEIAALHARVSDWFVSQQLVDEAINHALAAGEVTAAAQIVEQNRVAVLNANRWHDLAKWLAKLPAAIKQQRVGLLLARWWVAYHQFRVSELAGLLQRVEAELGKEPTEPALAAELYFFRGYIAFWLGDRSRAWRPSKRR
ncbi:MAG: hypothetical protein WBM40_01030, partial [Thiohalocapsa sp.]